MLYLIKDNSPLFIHIPVYLHYRGGNEGWGGGKGICEKKPTNIIINKQHFIVNCGRRKRFSVFYRQ